MNSFQRFIIKRSVIAVVLTIIAVSVIFFIIRLLPGTPYTQLLMSAQLDPAQIEALRQKFGLGKPLYAQYIDYVVSLLSFDFGYSVQSGQPVWEVIKPKLINSLILLVPALITTAVISSLAGIYAGWHRGSRFEYLSILLGTAFRSVPIFITGIFLLMIFSYTLDLTPVFGMRSPMATPDSWQELYLSWDFLHHYILPFLTAALVYSGDFLLLARNGVVERKGSAFLKLHQVKGLTENERLLRAGRNSMLPIITYFAVRMGMIFQGLILLEVVFAWPGIGRKLIIAITNQNYPLVQAGVFIMALTVIISNLVADILYGYFDPTINTEEMA